VGGLLAIGDSTQGTHFVAFDGNGNVSALIKAGDGTLAAQYEYGPFGELIRATGPLAFVNPFLFSTKFYDLETGLYYYGYRYYSPSTGMWLGRDPHRERGGHNLYGFVHNAPTARIDKLGLFPFCNRCNKLNEVRLIKTEWEIGTTEKTPQRIEALSDSLHEVEKWDKIVNVIEIFEGKPSILFPKPDLSSKQIPLDLLAYLPVNLFGRIKFKVCVNVGPRFFFFGSDQLDWVEYTEGWDASDRNPYQSGADAVDDVEHFMEEMFKNIKEQYL